MALKRLQYVINASLSPVSKFIEHYEMQFSSLGRRERRRRERAQPWHGHASLTLTFRVGLSIRPLTTAESLERALGREDKTVIALLKTQIYSNRVILFRGFD